ncbi:MAG: hypothetical protein WD904_04815 [Dehalococcoidia bacterium]
MITRRTAVLFPTLVVVAVLGVLIFTATRAPGPQRAEADHHLLRVDRVMADGDIQYVQLRMTTGGQGVVDGKQICFYDATGTPAGSFTFPEDLDVATDEATVLIGTAEFDAAWTGGDSDYQLTGHPVPHPAGKVTFGATCAAAPVDSVAYGAGYSGPVENPAKFPQDLPVDGQALRLDADAPNAPRVNADDYAIGAADFKKNNGTTGSLNETSTPTASPSPTATPTATPTLTPCPTVSPTNCDIVTNPPSPTPTPTATPTFTGTLPPGDERTWGDNNCSGPPPDPVDSLLTLRFDAGLPTNTGDCPPVGEVVEVANASPHPWGDVDCSGEVNPVDSLKLLRSDAGLPVNQPQDCPELGGAVIVTA